MRGDEGLIGEVTGLDHGAYYGLQVLKITGLMLSWQEVNLAVPEYLISEL